MKRERAGGVWGVTVKLFASEAAFLKLFVLLSHPSRHEKEGLGAPPGLGVLPDTPGVFGGPRPVGVPPAPEGIVSRRRRRRRLTNDFSWWLCGDGDPRARVEPARVKMDAVSRTSSGGEASREHSTEEDPGGPSSTYHCTAPRQPHQFMRSRTMAADDPTQVSASLLADNSRAASRSGSSSCSRQRRDRTDDLVPPLRRFLTLPGRRMHSQKLLFSSMSAMVPSSVHTFNVLTQVRLDLPSPSNPTHFAATHASAFVVRVP